jgi:hypothetical protein
MGGFRAQYFVSTLNICTVIVPFVELEENNSKWEPINPHIFSDTVKYGNRYFVLLQLKTLSFIEVYTLLPSHQINHYIAVTNFDRLSMPYK